MRAAGIKTFKKTKVCSFSNNKELNGMHLACNTNYSFISSMLNYTIGQNEIRHMFTTFVISVGLMPPPPTQQLVKYCENAYTDASCQPKFHEVLAYNTILYYHVLSTGHGNGILLQRKCKASFLPVQPITAVPRSLKGRVIQFSSISTSQNRYRPTMGCNW